MPPGGPSLQTVQRFLRAVERLGIVSEATLEQLRRRMLAEGRDVAWAGQELLKQSELRPRQLAALGRVLAEQGIETSPPSPEAEARAETQPARPDPRAPTQSLGGGRPSALQTRELVRAGPREPALGETVGERFVLSEELGRGAQGIVYRARDRKLPRDVAVKILRADAPGQAWERFEREAKLVSRLGHEGIVTVFDAGATARGGLYYAMELVEGPSLEDVVLGEGPLEVERIGRIVEAVALAIHHAHEAGLVHRDLKPGNVLLAEEERVVKVADFGLVTLAEGTRLTATRGVVGTPVYMAPEQAEGQRVDRRADIYSLGAILYEGLVGRPPFSGANPLEIFRRIVSEDPPAPRSLRPEVPALVEEVCLRALEKDPRARYSTAVSFARDLRRAVGGLRLVRRQPRAVVRRRLARVMRARPWAAGLTLGGLLGFALGASWGGLQRPAPSFQWVEPRPLPTPEPLSPEQQARRRTGRARLLGLARAERARGLHREALAWLRSLEAREARGDPTAAVDRGRARALAALSCLALDDPEQARAELAQALVSAPEDPLVAVARAAFARRGGRDAEAAACLAEALAAGPELVEAQLERACQARARGDADACAEALAKASELSGRPPWPTLVFARLRLAEEAGRFPSALRLAEALGGSAPAQLSPSRRVEDSIAAIDSRIRATVRTWLGPRVPPETGEDAEAPPPADESSAAEGEPPRKGVFLGPEPGEAPFPPVSAAAPPEGH